MPLKCACCHCFCCSAAINFEFHLLQFWPLGQHPAVQYASFQGTPTSVYIFIYLAVSKWGPGASLKSNVFVLQQKGLSFPSEWGQNLAHYKCHCGWRLFSATCPKFKSPFQEVSCQDLAFLQIQQQKYAWAVCSSSKRHRFQLFPRDSLKALHTPLFSGELNRV